MQMLVPASPRYDQHLCRIFVCDSTPFFDVLCIMVCTRSLWTSARPDSLVQKTSAQAPEGLDARVCAQRFTRSCATAGAKLSGQVQVRCLVHLLPSSGHGVHDAFSQIFSEGQTSALKFRFWKIPQKWLICAFFSDPWGSKWKLS